MTGHVSVEVWVADDDTYRHRASAESATITQWAGDFAVHSRSPVALRELSDYLRMAADELERAQRG